MKYIKKMSSVELPKINGSVVDTFNVPEKTTNAPSVRAVEEKLSYSTEEKHIGYWIDGKPIYRKVVTFTIGDNSNLTINHNIANVQKIWINEGKSFIGNYDESLSLNWFYATNDWCRCWVNITKGTIRFKSPSTLGERTCYVTLEYTKTTD